MARTFLIEAQPWSATTGAVVPVRLAGGGSRGYTHRGHDDWIAGVVGEPLATSLIGFDQTGFTGGAIPTTTAIAFAPSSRDKIDWLRTLVWAGTAITIYVGDDALAAPVWTVDLAGTVAGMTIAGNTMSLTISDLSGDLAKPVLVDHFTGDGGVEGIPEAKDRIKRRSWGRCWNVEARILDKANNIYEVGDPARPLQGITALKDKAREGPIVVLEWAGSIAATFAALQAAQAPAGGGVVAPSIACVKWWTQAPGPLTADLLGEVGGGYVDTAAQIAERIVAAKSTLTIANVAEAAGWRPDPAGLHVDSDGETAAAALDRLLLRTSLMWNLDPAGVIQLGQLSWVPEGDPIDAYRTDREAVYKPITSVMLGYQHNHRLHTDAELSAVFQASDGSYADGTPIEDLKPATPGATAGAPSGTTVGGTINPDTGEVEGGVPADDIAELPPRVQTIEDDVATVKGNIAELFDVFGDSESASASAAIAQQARDQAQAALAGSEDARDISIAKAQEAGIKAAAADASATLAGARATDSGNSADAAATSAQAAHTDATNSGTNAAAALASQVSATAVARGLLPSDFLSDGKFWFEGYQGDPASLPSIAQDARVTFPAIAGIGKVLQVKPSLLGATYYDAGQLGVTKLVPGRRYRVSVDYRATVLGDNPRIDAWAIYLSSSYAYVNSPSTSRTVPAANTRETVVIEIAGSTAIAAGAVYLRGMARMYGSGTYQLIAVVVEDITESAAAAGSATAAQGFSASAAASDTAAGQKASVATEQAGIATTKAGQAGASQQAAAISETNAAGSSAAAAASQQLTANAYRSTVLVGGNQQFDNGTDGWTNDPAPNTVMPAGQWVFNASYGGRTNVISTASASGRNIWSIKTYPITAGRKYKLRGSFHVGTGAAARMYMGVQCYDANGNTVGSNVGYMYILVGGSIYPSGSGWVDVESAVYPASSFNAGTAYVRLICWANYDNGAVVTALDYLTFEDVTGAADAETQAAISTNQAAIATNAAAAAQTSAVVSASVNSNAINPNGTFSDYPSAAVGAPPGNWSTGTGFGGMQRVVGENGIGYALRLPGNAGGDSYIYSASLNGSVRTGDWFVVEADVRLVSGTLTGAAALFQVLDSSGNTIQNLSLNIGAKYGAGVAGQTYRARQLFQVTAANASKSYTYAMSHWAGAGSNATANVIDWYRCLVRPATDQEIASKQATSDIASLNATVTQNVGAIADINGSAAFLEQIVAAGDGNPAIFRLLAGKDGSALWLMGDRIIVGNRITGQWVEVARFEDGVAKLNNALIRNLSVFPNATATLGFPVALDPKIFLANDGQVVSYGGSIGAPAARIEPDLSGIAVPAGSSLDVRALSSTANGFTARAKIIGSPTYANQAATGGTNVGGTPAWQMDKPTAADAYNGLYQVSATGTLTRTSYYRDDTNSWVGIYSGSMSFYVNNGSGFVFVGAVDGGGEFYYPTVPPATIPNTAFNHTFQYNGAIGSHGGKEFGVDGPITAFSRVAYTTLSAATETPITQNIPFKVYPSR
ncbi:hypothetical protein LZK98_08130 [Sphingomonas cannabina]|uniref:hypothetical protein n=1 Tax=Sphingomonas cannabina TaxID=2899123 RepID=UPI001F30D0E2|nr:hypothetical protein [Sphingomonas cannabina]UIJ46896.1 hypothetical protein LZK98_08130 [Sphingomonas cannabina]